ncbi:MAG TPA: sigma-54 dependent transcriptional regulator [Polyangia bacterium]
MSDFAVLVVDDEELYAHALGRELDRAGVRCDLAPTGSAALSLAEARPYDLILLDHRLPDDDGLRLIPLLLSRQPGAELVMMTAYDTVPNAVQAIRLGAEDYIVKETSLAPLLERVAEVRRRAAARRAAGGAPERGGLVGAAPPMVRLWDQLRALARSPATTVLIAGETGAGKEVAARTLHELTGGRPAGFVAVDCLALPEPLTESLLFGHERGAFTGAAETRLGACEQAAGGTLFLDEIGDLGEAVQGKLLRLLESRAFRRLGAARETPLTARIIAATNRDLAALARQGRFRRDLYERLSVFPLQIPPLRDRREDIPLLAEHFRALYAERLAKPIAPLDPAVVERLAAYAFPGNVRELRNVIERAVIVAEGEVIELKHLPARVLGEGAPPAPRPELAPGDTLGTLEQRMIRQALSKAHNVKAAAARMLGISRYQLLRRLEKYAIRPEGDED